MEKQNEIIFETVINTATHDFKIIYSPVEHETLKKAFAHASKTGKLRGIPDRILINDKCIIIVEIKHNDVKQARDDLMIYKTKIDFTYLPDKKIYYVAFVDDNIYDIFNADFIKQPLSIIQLLTMESITQNKPVLDFTKKISYLHNYIRDNTKISNEDKPFFISIILLSLKKESFVTIIKNYNSKQYIYDILIETIREHNIDTLIFDFLRNDKNNIHFLNIINAVIDIYNNDVDILNMFYTEFVKYENSDSKSLGIVLTPPHIVKLMVDMLNISRDDVILDICTGTGSFLCESYKHNPKMLIGCEYQTKLFSLLRCNMILRDIKNCALHKDDCFSINFEATKSIINPPYGMKDKNELQFINKQLDSVIDDGLVIAIVPISTISKQSKDRDAIFKRARVDTIIKCNENLFYPCAGVLCCIILLQKQNGGHTNTPIKLIDYSNDGYEFKRGYGRVKVETRDDILTNYITCDITIDSDWLIGLNTIRTGVNKIDINVALYELEHNSRTLQLYNTINNDIQPLYNYKDFKINELFTIEKKPSIKYTETDKYVNMVSAKKCNGGIKERIKCNKDTFYGNKIVLVTGGNGGAGLAYYHMDDFNISSTTCVLVPKSTFTMNKYVGLYCATELSKYKSIYSRGYTWNNDKIKSSVLRLPVNGVGDIDYELIHNLYLKTDL